MQSGRFGRIRRRLTFSAIVLVVALCLTELTLRLICPIEFVAQIRDAREFDEELGVRKRANVHGFKLADFQSETIANALGTSNFFDDFENYKHLVFTIGDSFTEGSGVPSDCSYPFQLDFLLNIQNDGSYVEDYAVVNLGLGGYGTNQQVIILQRYAARLGPPNYVLLLGCDNDFGDDRLFDNGYRHLSYVQGNPIRSRFAIAIAAIVDDLQLAKRIMLFRSWLIDRKFDDDAAAVEAVGPSTAEKQRLKLEDLRLQCQKMGAKLIVSWVAKPDQKKSYQWLKQWAISNDVAFADYIEAADAVQASKPKLGMVNQHATKHFRSWVNQLIAQAYARQIVATDKN